MTHQQLSVAASRRRLIVDGLGLTVSIVGFGLVYGLTARAAGLSPMEVGAMSALVFAGASQFAAVGYVVAGLPWLAIALLTALINSRHFLYSAALAPYLSGERRALRAAMAHFITDEAFALTIAHFRRIGRADVAGYWWAALGVVFVPWNVASVAGALIGGAIPDPRSFGLDVMFPAAMAGLALALIHGRSEFIAALAGAAIGVFAGVAVDPVVGIVGGGILGPLVALAARPSHRAFAGRPS